MNLLILCLIPLLPFVNGQYGDQPPAGTTTTTASPTTATSSTPSNIHIVNVGAGGLVYSPNSITAAVGDMVEFHFSSISHSVAQSSFGTHCAPANGTF